MSLRDQYIEKIKLQLDELNAQMYELEAKAKDVGEDARNHYKDEIRKLRMQSQKALDKYAELKVSSEDTWDKLFAGMENVRDAFIQSVHYFKSQL